MSIKWDLIVVLICFSLMTRDDEPLRVLAGNSRIFFGKTVIQVLCF